MKILHTESSCGWGGQEIRILDEAQGMIAAGHSLQIVCSAQSVIYREAQRRGVSVAALPIEAKTLRGLWAVWQWLREHPVDVVNTHSSTDAWLVALARLFLPRKPAVVRTRHVSAPIKPTWATRWLYRKGCDFVVTTGEKLREHVLERTGLTADKVKSVPTGVDTARFCPGDKTAARQQCGLPPDKMIIGIVATLRSWKGHTYLVEAVARLQREDVLLLIVGDGPNLPNIEAAIAKHQLHQQVIFAGQQADVVPWLRAMDIFVLPSYANEGVPQGLMQAMACGLPVVSTPVGSITELVADGRNGLLVPERDAVALSERLARLLSDVGERDNLGENASAFARDNCSSQAMLQRMTAVFQLMAVGKGQLASDV